MCSLDFVGYLFPIHRKYNINGMVDLFANLRVFSDNPDEKPINKKQYKKVIKHLLKTNFIYLTIDPFPEFDSLYTVPIDPEKTTFIDQPIFKNYLTED